MSQVSTNTWHHLSNLNWARSAAGCAIVTQMRDGHRWLMVSGGSSIYHVEHYDLTAGSGFHHTSNMEHNYYANQAHIVSVTDWEAFMMSGHTQWHGHSTRNWWIYNPVDKRWEVGEQFQ